MSVNFISILFFILAINFFLMAFGIFKINHKNEDAKQKTKKQFIGMGVFLIALAIIRLFLGS